VIALDTNVLVRILLHDDEVQARAAERVLVRARKDQTSLFVSDIVLCELVWVLSRRAELSRAAIGDAIDRLFRTELFVFHDAPAAERALTRYRTGKGDFADYLIQEHAAATGATHVITFDRQLRAEAGFQMLGT
jgi:predicted nucleic-acid-binding protein